MDMGVYIPWVRGFNLPYRGGSVFNKGVQYTMDVNRPRVQFTMGFKIPYDSNAYDVIGLVIGPRPAVSA
jgi:hypothetical protein